MLAKTFTPNSDTKGRSIQEFKTEECYKMISGEMPFAMTGMSAGKFQKSEVHLFTKLDLGKMPFATTGILGKCPNGTNQYPNK